MDADRDNLRQRREILSAYAAVLDRTEDLLRVCAATTGDLDDVRAAVMSEFDLGPVAAEAVLHLQVRRFTPEERRRVRSELAAIDRLTAGTDRTEARDGTHPRP